MGRKSSHRMGSGKHHEPPSAARTQPETRQFPPDVPHAHAGLHGTAVCERCHAIWHKKRWHLAEAEYATLLGESATTRTICPGCVAVERQEYDGEVRLRSPLIERDQTAILGLVRHTEALLREHNPLARIASIEHEPGELHILTISPFLAERIGKELRKAYDGHLLIEHAERERFVRVFWTRDNVAE
jgi:NMD protein affecting ribosome stability and mRNA decay